MLLMMGWRLAGMDGMVGTRGPLALAPIAGTGRGSRRGTATPGLSSASWPGVKGRTVGLADEGLMMREEERKRGMHC